MDQVVLQRFLESVGQKADVDLYLRLFREEKQRFAILVVDAAVVSNALEPLHFDLRLLAGLGLTPVVLLGVVDEAEAEKHAARVKEWLAEDGVDSQPIAGSAESGLVEAVRDRLAVGVLPVVWMAGPGETSVDQRFALLARLATALGSRRVVFVGAHAGLSRAGVAPPSVVNLTLDHDALLAGGTLTRKQAALLSQVKTLIERVPHRLSVAVTNPIQLLRELFTVKGAGTLIRKGSRVDRFDALGAVDRTLLTALLESSFGRRVRDEFWTRPIDRVYLEEAHQGVALFMTTALGPYLTKFAVERRAQGEGIGRDLWTAICRETPSFFWRARPDNPITPWYVQQSDGMQRMDGWQVFWKGVGVERIEGVIRWALEAPLDLAGPLPRRGAL